MRHGQARQGVARRGAAWLGQARQGFTLTKDEAHKIQQEIEALCRKYGLWFYVEHENKPDLRMIRVKEISIKVEDKDK